MPSTRKSKPKRNKPKNLILSMLATERNRARWAAMSPEARRAHSQMMNSRVDPAGRLRRLKLMRKKLAEVRAQRRAKGAA